MSGVEKGEIAQPATKMQARTPASERKTKTPSFFHLHFTGHAHNVPSPKTTITKPQQQRKQGQEIKTPCP